MFIHSSVEKHLGCFYLLTIVNNASMNMSVQMPVWDSTLNSFSYIPGSGNAELYGNSIFSFLKNHYSFRSSYTILHSYQQWTRVPVSLPPHQLLLFSIFLIVVILLGMRWYLIVVLMCISLMISDVEHFLMCLLAICITSLESCLFKSFSCFLIRLFVLLLSGRNSLCILDINSLSDIRFAKVFSHSIGCLFTLLIVSFDPQKFFILI